MYIKSLVIIIDEFNVRQDFEITDSFLYMVHLGLTTENRTTERQTFLSETYLYMDNLGLGPFFLKDLKIVETFVYIKT